MNSMTIHDLHEKLAAKEISAVELTKQVIAHRDAAEGEIHAYLSTSDEKALARAAAVDAKIAAGEAVSDLAGIPGAVKDNICIKGETCTAASRMLEHWVAPYNATVIEKLEAEDYISLGKTNLDEFAMGAAPRKIPISDRAAIRGIRNAFPAGLPAAARRRWRRMKRCGPSAPIRADRSASPLLSAGLSASNRRTVSSPATAFLPSRPLSTRSGRSRRT